MATSNDRAILNSIINPYLPMSGFEVVNEAEHECSNQENQDSTTELTAVAREFEKQAIALAESGNLEKALQQLDSAIEASPRWASAYNNRAQVLRLLNRNQEAMDDLNKAIEYSQGRGKAASQAFCQRAMLYHVSDQRELASKDWEAAANLGNSFAKNQMTQSNPYAAMCNKMLHDVFTKLKAGNVL